MSATAATAPAKADRPARSAASERFGYVVAIGCNAAVLYIAHHLLDWGWPRFLTDQFEEVLPLITFSLVVGMVTNALFVFYDARWFKSLVNLVTASIAFVVTLRMYQVYPFDFSDYAVDWSWLVTLLLVLGMVGTAIAVVVETVRLVTWPFRAHDERAG